MTAPTDPPVPSPRSRGVALAMAALLAERVEFAERLLARPRADQDEPSSLRRS